MTAPEKGPAARLAELLEGAPPEARREIITWLLQILPPRPAGSPAVAVPPHPGPMSEHLLGGHPPAELTERVHRLAGSLPAGTDSQMVTLRLPAERHAALRDWCTGHGFSMAAVVRGLVERFLEEQAA